MRKRQLLLWTPVVLGIALMLPATTLAGTYLSLVIDDNFCTGATATFAVTWTAKSTSGANKLTIDSRALVQYNDGSWHRRVVWSTRKNKFFINGQAHSVTLSRTYEATNKPVKIRFVMRAFYYPTNPANPIIYLGLKTRDSVVCYPPTS